MNSIRSFSVFQKSVLFLASVVVSSSFLSDAEILAQDEEAKSVAKVDENLLVLKNKLKSPRDTVRTFINAMEQQDFDLAYQCFDLSGLDSETATIKRETYAIKLKLAFRKYFAAGELYWLLTISNDPDEANQPYPVCEPLEGVEVYKDLNDLWRFTKRTAELLDGDRFDELIAQARNVQAEEIKELTWSLPLWLQQQFDESLWGTTFLIKDYQWICLLILFILGFVIGKLASIVLDNLTRLWFRFTSTVVDEVPRKKLWAPIVTLVHIGVWYYGTTLIDLPSAVMGIVLPVLKFFTVVAAVWTAFRAINLVQNYLSKRAARTKNRFDDSLVPLIGNALKLVAIILGVILFVDVFDKDWKAVLGGFGVAGIAVAIAAKDVLGNIFGSITVLADRPFEIGDWVVIDGNVEGTVEHVGIRSSRLRTFHNSQIVVPNSLLTTAIVDNMGRRQYRRFKTMLQVRYDTPAELLEAFCAGVRKLIKNSPYAKHEISHVYVNQLGEHSIDILVYTFFQCIDWATELRERHCLITDVLKLADELEIGFAFPTQTLEIEKMIAGSNHTGDGVDINGRSAGELGRDIADEIERLKNKNS